jgi:hypothetical protein
MGYYMTGATDSVKIPADTTLRERNIRHNQQVHCAELSVTKHMDS